MQIDTRHKSPPALPEGAAGFLTVRTDKPERMAIYLPNGTLSNTYGHSQTAEDIAQVAGIRIEPIGEGLWAVFL